MISKAASQCRFKCVKATGFYYVLYVERKFQSRLYFFSAVKLPASLVPNRLIRQLLVEIKGAQIWNNLPSGLVNLKSFEVLKKKCSIQNQRIANN